MSCDLCGIIFLLSNSPCASISTSASRPWSIWWSAASFLWFNQSDNIVSASLTGAIENEAIVFHPANADLHGRACQAVPAPDGFKNLLLGPIGHAFPTRARLGCEFGQGCLAHCAAIPGVGLVLDRGQPTESNWGGVTADLLVRT